MSVLERTLAVSVRVISKVQAKVTKMENIASTFNQYVTHEMGTISDQMSLWAIH